MKRKPLCECEDFVGSFGGTACETCRFVEGGPLNRDRGDNEWGFECLQSGTDEYFYERGDECPKYDSCYDPED